MYYIYEIVGVKIGCTNDMVRRQKEQLSKGKMVLLEEYTTIEEASVRERELQLDRGYPVERTNYAFALKRQKIANSPEVRKRAAKTISSNWKSKSSYKEGRDKCAIKFSKPIGQYSLGNKLIKHWQSIQELRRNKLYPHYSIQVNKPYKGYIWKYI